MSRKSKKNITHDEMLDLAIIPNTEELYGIPNNWCWITLSSIASVISKGTTPKGGKNAYLSSGVDFLRVENICEDGTISHDNIMHIDESMHFGFLKRSVLKRGDVLVSIAGTLGKTALVRDIDLPLNTNQAVCFIRIRSDEVNKKYIKYAIDNPIIQRDLLAQTKVTAIPNLTLEIISGCPIPFPPYIEQNRIVARIDGLFAKLDEAKEKAQEVIDGFDDRKSAILHKAFSGDLTAEWRNQNDQRLKKWENKLLGNVTDNYDSKRIPLSKAEREKLEKKYNYYGASGIIDKVDQFIFDGKYLLIGEDGANLVMRSKPIAFIADGKFWVNNHAHVLKVKPDINMEYLCYYINSISLAPYVTGSAQPKMSQSKMNTIPVPIPEYAEQNEIVRILDSLVLREQKAKETAEQVIKQIEVMKKAILARAFRGELGTNDPNDEPAIELLKRVLSDESTKDNESKPVKKRITIPKELSNQLGTAMERKIIRLYFEMDTDVLSLDNIFSVSSKKLDILDCIRTLEKKQIIIQEENGKYRLVR